MASATTRKEVRCPYCTQSVGTHPSGVMLPHTTRRNGTGSECWGSREETIMGNTAETKASIKRMESDLKELNSRRDKASARDRKDIDKQISKIKETIKIYKSMV